MLQNLKVVYFPGWIIALCVVSSIILARKEKLNVNEKFILPKLYEYDDFIKCRKENPKFQFCVVEAVIQPDHSSGLWDYISKISSSRLNFPRDHYERGMCLQNCMKRLNKTLEASDSTDIDDSQRFNYLSICANQSLQLCSNLQTSMSIKNCVTYKNWNQPLKPAEIACIAVIVVIALAVVFATIYEHVGYQHMFVEAFSLNRNMARLFNTENQPPNFPFLEGVRIILMVAVLIAHAYSSTLRSPLKNPEVIELQTNSFLFPFMNSINTHVISMFFTIAGMVQSDSFHSVMETSVGCVQFRFVLRKIFRRLANLIPAYAFIIFYQATLFPRTKSTPVAYKFADYCDRHWWTNLLFINNYVHAEEPCMMFGWYLGADFQLFLASTAIMMVIWRFPRTKMLCAYLMIAISLAIPAFVIYTERLDAFLTLDIVHLFNDNTTYDAFLKNYIPSTVNAGHYFFGMVAGLTYRYISKNNDLHPKALSYTSTLFANVSLLFLALNGLILVLPSFPKPSIILALYGTSLKAIWSITNGTLLLYLGIRSKSKIVAFLAHPKNQILTRLSFCIYIVQYSVINTFYSNLSFPITNDASHVILTTSIISLVTFASGLLLHLAVQSPCTFLLNRIIDNTIGVARRKKALQMMK